MLAQLCLLPSIRGSSCLVQGSLSGPLLYGPGKLALSVHSSLKGAGAACFAQYVWAFSVGLSVAGGPSATVGSALAAGGAGSETMQEHLYLEINKMQTKLKLRKRI